MQSNSFVCNFEKKIQGLSGVKYAILCQILTLIGNFGTFLSIQQNSQVVNKHHLKALERYRKISSVRHFFTVF